MLYRVLDLTYILYIKNISIVARIVQVPPRKCRLPVSFNFLLIIQPRGPQRELLVCSPHASSMPSTVPADLLCSCCHSWNYGEDTSVSGAWSGLEVRWEKEASEPLLDLLWSWDSKNHHPKPALDSTNINSLLNKFISPPQDPSTSMLRFSSCTAQCLGLCIEFCILFSLKWGSNRGKKITRRSSPQYLMYLVPSHPQSWLQAEQIWLWVIAFHVLDQRHWDNNFPNIVLRDGYHCKTIFCHQAVSKRQCHLADTQGWGGRWGHSSAGRSGGGS